MSSKKLNIGLAGLAVLAAVTTFFIVGRSEKDEPNESGQIPPVSTNQGSSLPSKEVQNLEQAKQSLSFEPLTPSKQINDETLSNVKVGTKGMALDDSDTLYLTYSDNQGTLYKMAQTTKKLAYPTDADEVSLTIGSNKVNAFFHQLADAEDTGGPNSAGVDVTTPRSYIFWTMDKVHYEISEFGRVTKQQLIELASSLK